MMGSTLCEGLMRDCFYCVPHTLYINCTGVGIEREKHVKLVKHVYNRPKQNHLRTHAPTNSTMITWSFLNARLPASVSTRLPRHAKHHSLSLCLATPPTAPPSQTNHKQHVATWIDAHVQQQPGAVTPLRYCGWKHRLPCTPLLHSPLAHQSTGTCMKSMCRLLQHHKRCQRLGKPLPSYS